MRPAALALALLVSSAAGAEEPATAPQPAPSPPAPAPTPAPAPAPPSVAPPASTRLKPAPVGATVGWQESGWWWDLNVEGGGGIWIAPGRSAFGMGRVRGGALYMAEPWYLSAGALYEYSSLAPATFGLQVEAMHLWTGYWIQAGGLFNNLGRAGAQLSVGASVVGLEAQAWPSNGPDKLVVLLKLRVPISWLFQVGKPPRISRPSP